MTAALHTLQRFVLRVPDVARSVAFYDAFGLGVEADGDRARLGVADGRVVAEVREGARKELAEIVFSAHADVMPRLGAQVEAAGGAILPPDDLGLLFQDRDGNVIRVVAEEARVPRLVGARDLIVRVGAHAAPKPDHPVRLDRISHVLLFTPDINRAIRFYSEAFGFRLSDSSKDLVAFLHLPHGSDHHQLAFVQTRHKGFHHVAFDVPTIDSVGLGAQRMSGKGFAKGWGFGRHLAGSNYFHYVRDPYGSFAEYSCDIDYVPEGTVWEPRDLPRELSLHTWGPAPPEYFVVNTEEPGYVDRF